MTSRVCDHGDHKLLEVRRLRVRVPGRRGSQGFYAVDDVSFSLGRGESIAIVGESGCGKSTLVNAVVRLIKPTQGIVVIQGIDWSTLSGGALRRRRSAVQMVFQNPYGSLNPRWSIGSAIEEPLRLHTNLNTAARRQRAYQLLKQVGLPSDIYLRKPRALSGGQRQRVAIARALACQPSLLICDEPTAALDVSVQAQVLNLLADLQKQTQISYLLVTHDLAIVRHVAHRVAVMYMGQFVEEGPVDAVFRTPLHPYTAMLLSSVMIEVTGAKPMTESGSVGEPGDPANPPSGCRFRPRCAYAVEICKTVSPPVSTAAIDRTVSCHEWRRLTPLKGISQRAVGLPQRATRD